jgi:group I intron endonuclease
MSAKCGIYLIRNNRNNLVYIGQSIHIEQRIKQHFSQQNKDRTLIDSAIAEYPEDFSWEILQECPREELNYWEDYYIYYYNSMNFGYNRVYGGQAANRVFGENHHAAMYTNEQMMKMRKEYVYTPIEELYEKYGRKNITLYAFKNSLLQNYKNLPIYRKEKKMWIYPPGWNGEQLEVNTGSRSGLSVNEIMTVRRLSLYHSLDEIMVMDASKPFKSRRHLQETLNGRLFNWLPYYSRKESKWIYPSNWEGEKEKELDENDQDFSNIILRKIADKGRKLSNYNIILIRLLAIKGERPPQIIKKIGLEGKISEDMIELVIKGKSYTYLPYYNFNKQWIFPTSYTEGQKEKFLQIISTIGDE